MKRSLVLIALLAFTVTVAGCSGTSTKFSGTWLNPDYQDEELDDVLVIAIADSDVNRRIYESALVDHMTDAGVTAYQSATLLPTKEMLTKEEVEKLISEKTIDAVIVTRLVKIDEDEVYVPPTTYVSSYPSYGAPYYGSYYGYYSYGYGVATSPGYTYTETTVTLEINLYDAATEAIAWSAQSQTFNPSSPEDVIRPTTKMIVDKLIDDGLIHVKKEK